MNLPEPEYQIIPEGTYEFRITAEPEVKKTSYQKNGQTVASKYVKVKLAVRLSAGSRERNYTENFFCHEQRYRDLLAALGGRQSEDGQFHTPDSFRVVGMTFEAKLVHVPDKRDPSITRTRIQDIKVQKEEDDIPPPAEGTEDDGVPF
jgi:hypothetical protein